MNSRMRQAQYQSSYHHISTPRLEEPFLRIGKTVSDMVSWADYYLYDGSPEASQEAQSPITHEGGLYIILYHC